MKKVIYPKIGGVDSIEIIKMVLQDSETEIFKIKAELEKRYWIIII